MIGRECANHGSESVGEGAEADAKVGAMVGPAVLLDHALLVVPPRHRAAQLEKRPEVVVREVLLPFGKKKKKTKKIQKSKIKPRIEQGEITSGARNSTLPSLSIFAPPP